MPKNVRDLNEDGLILDSWCIDAWKWIWGLIRMKRLRLISENMDWCNLDCCEYL